MVLATHMRSIITDDVDPLSYIVICIDESFENYDVWVLGVCSLQRRIPNLGSVAQLFNAYFNIMHVHYIWF